MHYENSKADYTGQSIYAGIDVHKKSWNVCIMTDYLEHKSFSMPASPEVLISYLSKNFPKGSYKCVYEAGYSGFWIYEKLKQNNIECIVVNPADVPSQDKEKRFKTDRIDSRKLARSLRNGDIEGIYVPDQKMSQDRAMIRVRQMLVRKMTRVKNQIKGFLSYYGLGGPDRTYWSSRYIEYIENVKMSESSGKIAIKMLLDEYKELRQRLLEITKHIRELSKTDRYINNVANLVSIPGISTLSAMILLTEIGEIKRFRSFDKLNSYAGLRPGEYSSGEREVKYSMTLRCNANIRKVLIESAWTAARRDPALLLSFNQYCHRMCKNKAIVKIAKKLLNRIKYVLLNNRPYALGILN